MRLPLPGCHPASLSWKTPPMFQHKRGPSPRRVSPPVVLRALALRHACERRRNHRMEIVHGINKVFPRIEGVGETRRPLIGAPA